MEKAARENQSSNKLLLQKTEMILKTLVSVNLNLNQTEL